MKAAILLPVLCGRDAVGNDAIEMARLLRNRGIDTRVFCDSAMDVDERVQPADRALAFAGGSQDLVIYHFSVGWERGVDILRRARGFRVVRYHNITPPHFFAGMSRPHELACERGRAEIATVAQLGCELYLACSVYNANELIDHGAPAARCAVLAPFHRIEQLLLAQADLALLDRLGDGARNVLMVGRVAPNKGHGELVDAFAAYVDAYGDPARLIIVGKSDPALAIYAAHVQARIHSHRLGNRVFWLESANEAQLKAAYLASHAFMTLSRHEGFCVPLIEAMALGVPIVAHDAGAIAQTVGTGGIVWESIDPWLYAASLARLSVDMQARSDLIEAAHVRYAREFAPAILRKRFFEALGDLL